jgi:two-component system cell cycle response regulator
MANLPEETTVAGRLSMVEPADDPTNIRNPYLTVLTGAFVGRTYQLGPGRLIVGRAADCDIALDDSGVSRRHALLVSTAEGSVSVEDLGSTNGTMVDGARIEVRELGGGERLQFGSDTVFKFEFRDSIEERFVSYLYESATRDHLTGVFNERFLREQLRVELAWHRRHQDPMCLILLDVDFFKKVNDEYGHLMGDSVLRQLASRCQGACRVEDVLARYGGEEFACLVRHTDAAGAVVLAERMRRVVDAAPFQHGSSGRGPSVPVTISLGVAQLTPEMEEPEALIAAADRMLYRAKHAGRNRVEFES